ncbi:hypothetical protein [Synechococcus sp. 1G10]|uniref:hypothetical protein n=1 Tax=Synechococcus sp. 1G10 TaxID=2025605 RepID=UPI00118105F3|nr:hypothetical protein [Synechococcus sp. 1G10]
MTGASNSIVPRSLTQPAPLRCHASLLACPPPPDAPALLRSLPGIRCDQADPSRCQWCIHPSREADAPMDQPPRRARLFF